MNKANLSEKPSTKRDKGPSVKRVPAVRRASAILWELSNRSAPMNLSQVARAVDVIPSTCLHILRELVSARLVSYDSGSKTYQLGAGISDLARSAVKLNNFAELVKPWLQMIADRFNMTTTATSKVDDQHLALIGFANPPNAISIRVTLGGRVPLVSGASGRIFAAFGGMTDKQIRRNFNKVKWVQPIAFEKWASQVEETKQRGYAEDREGFVEGVSTLAVPVFSPDGSVSHTIGVFAINSQLEVSSRDEIVKALRDAADDIHKRLNV